MYTENMNSQFKNNFTSHSQSEEIENVHRKYEFTI